MNLKTVPKTKLAPPSIKTITIEVTIVFSDTLTSNLCPHMVIEVNATIPSPAIGNNIKGKFFKSFFIVGTVRKLNSRKITPSKNELIVELLSLKYSIPPRHAKKILRNLANKIDSNNIIHLADFPHILLTHPLVPYLHKKY